MKNTNKLIDALYGRLEQELRERPAVYSLRTLSAMDKQRQGLALTNNRYFITILERHILEATQSVVFFIEITEDYYLLQMCCPLKEAQRQALAAAGYVSKMRSKWMLAVGLEQNPAYAYSSIKLSPYSSVIDLFDGLFVLKRELELFLAHIR